MQRKRVSRGASEYPLNRVLTTAERIDVRTVVRKAIILFEDDEDLLQRFPRFLPPAQKDYANQELRKREKAGLRLLNCKLCLTSQTNEEDYDRHTRGCPHHNTLGDRPKFQRGIVMGKVR
jgi:hypothetical protein